MKPVQVAEFKLNPNLNLSRLADRFASFGRMQIADFLDPESAHQLCSYLEQSHGWHHLFNSGERNWEFPIAEWEALPSDKRNELLTVINERAAYDFQYQYDTIRVHWDANGQPASNSLLDQFAQFFTSPPVLDVLMRITNANDLVYADCQATRYRSGDFLTPHNDELDGMHRRFAYVLSLARDWRPRWGGLLHFIDSQGTVEETVMPRFNALSLFAIGQSHYVSQVATYAPLPRISVTGWLRTQVPI